MANLAFELLGRLPEIFDQLVADLEVREVPGTDEGFFAAEFDFTHHCILGWFNADRQFQAACAWATYSRRLDRLSSIGAFSGPSWQPSPVEVGDMLRWKMLYDR